MCDEASEIVGDEKCQCVGDFGGDATSSAVAGGKIEEAVQQASDNAKFVAYQAQRNELRLRLRELRVHAAQRVLDAKNLKAEGDRLLNEGQQLNKIEIPNLLHALRSRQARRGAEDQQLRLEKQRILIEGYAINKIEIAKFLRGIGLY